MIGEPLPGSLAHALAELKRLRLAREQSEQVMNHASRQFGNAVADEERAKLTLNRLIEELTRTGGERRAEAGIGPRKEAAK